MEFTNSRLLEGNDGQDSSPSKRSRVGGARGARGARGKGKANRNIQQQPNHRQDSEGNTNNRGRGRGGRSRSRRRRGRGRGREVRENGAPKDEDQFANAKKTNGDLHAEHIQEDDVKTKNMSEITFRSLGNALSSNTLKAIEDKLGFDRMTRVQAATMESILNGKDVIARAKTGTGKTVGFLLPAIETVVRAKREESPVHISSKEAPISVLVISPTRELAAQIEKECKLLTFFHNNIRSSVMVGGVSSSKDKQTLNHAVDIVVATPARLLSNLRENPVFASRFTDSRFFVLDEADQLLEMGFLPDILKIQSFLPKPDNRQTLLFSATVPSKMHQVARQVLRSEHEFIDTVGEEDEATHKHVEQHVAVVPFSKQWEALYLILLDQLRAKPQAKSMVFFNTARVCGFAAMLFSQMFRDTNIVVLEMHSRKSQSYRTKVANTFRTKAGPMFMCSSDVSARGVHYPNVDFVTQFGLTSDGEQYVHRLGRTARAGASGKGMLILSEFEQKAMLRSVEGLPLKTFDLDFDDESDWLQNVQNAVSKQKDLTIAAKTAYQAWLGFYKSNLKRLKLSPAEIVAKANEFSIACGLKTQPGLLKRTVGKMGLKGVPGIIIEKPGNR